MANLSIKHVTEKAVSGVAWTMMMSMGARVLQIVGTIYITYYLLPSEVSEVTNAAAILIAANTFTALAIPQYLVTRQELENKHIWHGLLFTLVTGAIALGAVVVFRHPISVFFKAPGMAVAMPGLALSTMLVRIGAIPERLLVRKLDFRMASLGRGLSEVAFPVVAVGFAVAGFHGMSIVFANIARSLVVILWMSLAMPIKTWICPTGYDRAVIKDMFRFGLPFTVAMLSNNAARSWDNLIMSRLFGPGPAGLYAQAYNLTEIPVIQVTEQIGDVLTPSMVNLSKEDRKVALVRSTALTCLLVFPLTVGLAVVAPTLVTTLLRKEWSGVAPFLTILAAAAVVRPVGTLVASYLQSSDRPRSFMVLNLLGVASLLGLVTLFGWLFGPLWACLGVGLGFVLSSLAAVALVCHQDKIKWGGFAKGYFLPLMACVPMIVLVLLARQGLETVGLRTNWLRLVLEIGAGAVGYIAGAFTIARPIAMDFVGILKDIIARKRGQK